MKSVFLLALVCLVVLNAVDGKAHDKKHHDKKHHLKHHSKHGSLHANVRTSEDRQICIQKCIAKYPDPTPKPDTPPTDPPTDAPTEPPTDAPTPSIDTPKPTVDTKGKIYKIGVYYIIYDKETGFFAIFNTKLNIAIVYFLNTNYVAIVSFKDGGAILIDVKTKKALYIKIEGVAGIAIDAEDKIIAAFVLIFTESKKNFESINVDGEFHFDICILLKKVIETGKVDATDGFEGQETLVEKLQGSFSEYFAFIFSLKESKEVVLEFSNVWVIVFGACHDDATGSVLIVYQIIVSIDFEAAGEQAAEIFAKIMAAIKAKSNAILEKIRMVLCAVGTIYKDIASAIIAIETAKIEMIKKVINGVVCFLNVLKTNDAWVIQITKNNNVVFEIYIKLSGSTKFIAFYNMTLQYALVISLSKGTAALCNMSTGVVIIIKGATGILIAAHAEEIKKLAGNLGAAFEFICNISATAQGAISFDLVAMLKATFGGNADYDFAGNVELKKEMQLSFGGLLAFKGEYKESCGAFNILFAIGAEIKGDAFIDSMAGLCAFLAGSFGKIIALGGMFFGIFQKIVGQIIASFSMSAAFDFSGSFSFGG